MFSLASSLPSQTSANIFKESLQPLTEGHRISLGILYAPVCFGQSSQFPASVLLNLLQARRRSEPLALLHYACKQRCGSFVAFALAGDNVAAEVVAGSAKPKNLFPPGMGGFFFAEFRAIGRPLGGLDVHEFVHAAEGGGVFGGGERGAPPGPADHAPVWRVPIDRHCRGAHPSGAGPRELFSRLRRACHTCPPAILRVRERASGSGGRPLPRSCRPSRRSAPMCRRWVYRSARPLARWNCRRNHRCTPHARPAPRLPAHEHAVSQTRRHHVLLQRQLLAPPSMQSSSETSAWRAGMSPRSVLR